MVGREKGWGKTWKGGRIITIWISVVAKNDKSLKTTAMALTGSMLYLKTCVPSRLNLFFIPFLKVAVGVGEVRNNQTD